MKTLGLIAGLGLILGIWWDAFETVILPRRVTRRFRISRTFYRTSWIPFSAFLRKMSAGKRRETLLGYYGPLSLLMLLSIWATALIFGFALLHWSVGTKLNAPQESVQFTTYAYLSGVTFFTLGFGDLVPLEPLGRVLAVLECGTGFGFLAIIIGYLPVIYQAFSRREATISLLDARAGSPPTALELLRRHSEDGGMDELKQVLKDLERWSAELLESHLSYVVLCFYRSQHTNQSWIAALAAILDATALVIVGLDGAPLRQARLTFAMARHAVVDLAQIFSTAPKPMEEDRLPGPALAELRSRLGEVGLRLREGDDATAHLTALRAKYEPYLNALGYYLLMDLPPWMTRAEKADNWQVSAWDRGKPGSMLTDRDPRHF